MRYPKINTLWKRDEKNKFNIIEGDYSCPEFENINKWILSEKIDGTNIRIFWEDEDVSFGGRTDSAQIPAFLFNYLKNTFTPKKFSEFDHPMTLFGEGFGNRIQSAGPKYRKDVSFILFDIKIGQWWLEQDKVKEIASQIGIESVPSLGIMTIKEAVDYVKGYPSSTIAEKPLRMEGIVARSHPQMLFRDGNPIMWKLKAKDYLKLGEKDKNEM